MRKLLILGASEFQIPLIEAAKRKGIHTCVLDINPSAPACNIADEYHHCSLKDYNMARSIAEHYHPDGITAGMCDVAVLTVARICECLKLPGLDVETAIKATDKYAMIRAFENAGVPCPHYFSLKKGNTFRLDDLPPFPIIVKPTDMAGSRGINLIKTLEQVPSMVADSISASDKGDIIFEEFMVGPEVSVEIVVRAGTPSIIQITDKITSGAPHFIELGHIQPSNLPEKDIVAISRVATQAVLALGLHNSIVHAELILTEDGPKMVELGARMGGDGIHQQLIQLSTGIDLPALAIHIAFGEPFEIPSPTSHHTSMIRFIPSNPGKVKDIHIPLFVKEDPCFRFCKLFCKPGDIISERHDNSGRFGYILAQGDSVPEVKSCCEKALRGISIDMTLLT